jgi:hypothetical protein
MTSGPRDPFGMVKILRGFLGDFFFMKILSASLNGSDLTGIIYEAAKLLLSILDLCSQDSTGSCQTISILAWNVLGSLASIFAFRMLPYASAILLGFCNQTDYLISAKLWILISRI